MTAKKRRVMATLSIAAAILFTACSLGGGGADGEEEGMGETPADVTGAPASAPTGLGAYADSTSSVVITWTALASAAGYKVYQSTSTGGTYTLVGSPKGTKYTHKGLASDTTYFYKAAGVNKYGEGPKSSYVSAEIKKLPPPTGLHVEALSDTSLEINYNAVEGAISYAIFRGDKGQVATTTETNYTDTGLDPYKQYSYTVASVTSVGTGAKSAAVTEYTQPIPLQEGVWKDAARTYSNETYFYSFPVQGGTYYVRWNNSYDGDGSKSGFAYVSAYLKSDNSMSNLAATGSKYFSNVQQGYTTPQEINVPSPAFVVLMVSSGNGGTFAIQYYR